MCVCVCEREREREREAGRGDNKFHNKEIRKIVYSYYTVTEATNEAHQNKHFPPKPRSDNEQLLYLTLVLVRFRIKNTTYNIKFLVSTLWLLVKYFYVTEKIFESNFVLMSLFKIDKYFWARIEKSN